MRYRSRTNSSASRQNVCPGGLAGVRRDPLFAVSDEQCTSCSDSPMFSGPEDPGNEDIGERHMLQNHSADLSSSFAPIAVMSVAGPEVWSCEAISDLNIIGKFIAAEYSAALKLRRSRSALRLQLQSWNGFGASAADE